VPPFWVKRDDIEFSIMAAVRPRLHLDVPADVVPLALVPLRRELFEKVGSHEALSDGA